MSIAPTDAAVPGSEDKDDSTGTTEPLVRGLAIDWIPLDLVMNIVADAREGRWNWWANSRCKYIGVRIDMRDGHCVLTDRHGERIDLTTLAYQYQLPSRSSSEHRSGSMDADG